MEEILQENFLFAQGEIQCFDNYKIKHLVSTHHGSSGSPILLQNNFTTIGIHKAGNPKKKENIGIFFKNILTHFLLENNLIVNQIICEYNIKNKNKDIQILNCYEEAKKEDPEEPFWDEIECVENEKEIKDKSELYLNNQKIQFCFKYKFEIEGKNTINIIFNNLLKNTNFMFYKCSRLTSLNLSNFNAYNFNNISYMFSGCSSLTSLNLSNFNTNNVNNMRRMFSGCSSLTSLSLSNFNTNNVNNMSYMFVGCSSLKSLNLSDFNTKNVKNMSSMFYECSSLTSLNTKDERILEEWKN